MEKQSLLNDIRLLTGQESDIRDQIRELTIQALALRQEIKAHEQELEALNKSISFQ
jgi:chromosome segregation ATPase